jgi:NAD(P)H-flavin reductase
MAINKINKNQSNLFYFLRPDNIFGDRAGQFVFVHLSGNATRSNYI